MILTGGHLFIGKCPMSYPGTSHWCRTQNNYGNWKQRLTHCHLIWLSPDIDFFMPPKIRPCIWINRIFGSFEGSTFFCLPTFWSTLGGWVNRCFRWRVQWIERYSSDSWSKNHMLKLPPKHHHPKTAPNIIKNLRCDGIEQWNFNQPPTTPGVPPYGESFCEMIEVVWTRPSRCLNVHFNVVCLTRLELQSNLCIQKCLKL